MRENLQSGTGQHNGGVRRTGDGAVAKRLLRGPEQPRHHAYWRRQALVAVSGLLAHTPGLRAPETLGVEEDADGITLRTAWVEPVPRDDLRLAASLGRFAAADLAEPGWGARGVLRTRLNTVERRGGWSPLAAVDLSFRSAIDELWVRRDVVLAEVDALPRVPTHGDAHPANLLGRDGDDVVAIDWEQFGFGPIGFDLGYLLLASDRSLDDLLEAFGDRPGARRGAVLTAALTGVSRAAWAMGRPEEGELLGRLTGLRDVVVEALDAN